MTPKQLHILQHAIGHTKTGEPWRNRYVIGASADAFSDCQALVVSGHMTRRPYALNEIDTEWIYSCTESGIAAARAEGGAA